MFLGCCLVFVNIHALVLLVCVYVWSKILLSQKLFLRTFQKKVNHSRDKSDKFLNSASTHLILTCSKSTLETLEKGVLFLTLNIFHNFIYCFYRYFEQLNVSWV